MTTPARQDKTVVLLDDLPANEDAFGAHKRIAQSIRELITTENGGKAIALVGSWGGGKSTVINLLRPREKTENDDLAVFVFDAWVHEGDPLRRTFLEKFITFLTDRRWIATPKWQRKLKELSRRYVETETETTPQLTVPGVVCAISILVGTIGLAMVSAGIDRLAWNIVGFVLTAIPFAVLFFGWRIAISKNSEEVLRYFVNKQRETNKTSTIETPDPTSVEFQSWFCGLAAEALSGDRKILLVIDNLDRVHPEDALKLWSAMRTFVDFSGIETPGWLSKLWVLAAFDERGIKRLWENGGNNSLATTFLEKTFQIRFRIPSPILSDWREFLTHQLKRGFPKATADDCYKISRIYEILKVAKTPPTPREMKVFVNQVGSIYRTAPQEDIPLPHMSLYAALVDRETDWNPTKEIPEIEHLNPHLGADSDKHLAALYFNMPSDKAVQVFIGEQVEKAVSAGKPEILEIYAGKNWLGVVIEEVISRRLPEWLKNEPQLIGRAAFVCTSDAVKISVNEQTFIMLLRGLKEVKSWTRMDSVCGAGIAALIERPAFADLAKPLVAAFSVTTLPSDSKDTRPDLANVRQWIRGVSEIVGTLQKLDQSESHLGNFVVGTTPDDYLLILAEVLGSCPKEIWKYFRPACAAQDVLDHLNHHIASGTFETIYEQAIQVMKVVSCDWPWDKLAAFPGRLQTAQLQPGQFGRLMRVLIGLRDQLPENTLSDIVRTGWIYHHFYAAQSTSNHNEAASAILGILFSDSEGNQGANPTNPQSTQGRNVYRSCITRPDQYKELVNDIFEQVVSLSCTNNILEMRKQETSSKPLLDLILIRAAQGDDCINHFPAVAIVENYQMLTTVLDATTLANLIKASIETGTLEFDLAQAPLSPRNAGLFRAALQLRRTKILTDQVVKGINRLLKNDFLGEKALNNSMISMVVFEKHGFFNTLLRAFAKTIG
jgi:hypothetical protein